MFRYAGSSQPCPQTAKIVSYRRHNKSMAAALRACLSHLRRQPRSLRDGLSPIRGGVSRDPCNPRVGILAQAVRGQGRQNVPIPPLLASPGDVLDTRASFSSWRRIALTPHSSISFLQTNIAFTFRQIDQSDEGRIPLTRSSKHGHITEYGW